LINNNVLELWSLFDFLMPGFLGTERQFYEKYEKPIMHKGEEKPSTPKNDETAMLALENLHRQVLPFILRRVKEDVLKDLPPKIIQDYYCQLSPLQASLYDEFSKTLLGDELRSAAWSLQDGQTPAKKSSSSEEASVHIFQALQYLRKLCSHPKLVLTNKHPEYLKLQSENVNINSIEHSPKLVALKQLLNDCGIGVDSGQEDTSLSTVTNHRVLIFCQLKAMLDIIETDCLASFMPQVTYLRLDGNTELSKRHEIVQKFNCDPTIDLLLLTTHIGGLGLNLTGADTVIFMEHDWNPMKDLQAMDRAHRIGQKKVVNVYRFIMKNTLEEKIMGLQKFKLNLANTVISTENASLQGLNTTQLLDLLGDEKKSKASSKSNSESKQNLREVVEQLSDLWEQSQYDEEYNLDSFLEKLS
jgi:TATA-binding protein-associated factor